LERKYFHPVEQFGWEVSTRIPKPPPISKVDKLEEVERGVE